MFKTKTTNTQKILLVITIGLLSIIFSIILIKSNRPVEVDTNILKFRGDGQTLEFMGTQSLN